MKQRIKKPLNLMGLELSPEHPEQLELSEDVQRTLSIIMGQSEDNTIPLRCDDTGHLFTREFDRTSMVCLSGTVLSTETEDLSGVYHYIEGFMKEGICFLDLGIESGSFPWRLQPYSISAGYDGTAVYTVSIIRAFGKFRYLKPTNVMGGVPVTFYYSVYQFPKR